jgi:hypothetical protein
MAYPSYEPSLDTAAIATELKAVRAKRDALERAQGLVSAASRQKSLQVVRGLFEESVKLRCTIGELKATMQKDADRWSSDLVSTSAHLHRERAKYFETMSRSLSEWRETTMRTARQQHAPQAASLPSGPATPDLLWGATKTDQKEMPKQGADAVRSTTEQNVSVHLSSCSNPCHSLP